MCNPLSIISSALTVGGGLFKAAGARSAAKRDSKAALYAAEIARNNAAIARAEGLAKENALRARVERVIGQQQKSFAARGIDPGAGSPLALAAFSAGQGEIDARLIRAETLTDVASNLADAGAYTAKAEDSRVAGIYGAGTALLTTAQDVWPQLQGAFRKSKPQSAPAFGLY